MQIAAFGKVGIKIRLGPEPSAAAHCLPDSFHPNPPLVLSSSV